MIHDLADLELVLRQYHPERVLVGPVLHLWSNSSFRVFNIAGNGGKIHETIGLGFVRSETDARRRRSDIVAVLQTRFDEVQTFDSQLEMAQVANTLWANDETSRFLATTTVESKLRQTRKVNQQQNLDDASKSGLLPNDRDKEFVGEAARGQVVPDAASVHAPLLTPGQAQAIPACDPTQTEAPLDLPKVHASLPADCALLTLAAPKPSTANTETTADETDANTETIAKIDANPEPVARTDAKIQTCTLAYVDDLVIRRGFAAEALAWTMTVIGRLGQTVNGSKTAFKDAPRKGLDFVGTITLTDANTKAVELTAANTKAVALTAANTEMAARSDTSTETAAETDANTEAVALTDANTEVAARPDASTETAAETDANAEAAARPDTGIKTPAETANTEAIALADSNTEVAAETDANTEMAARPDTSIETAAETDANTETAAETANTGAVALADANAEMAARPDTSTETAAETDANTETAAETGNTEAVARSEANTETAAEPEANIEEAAETESDTETAAEAANTEAVALTDVNTEMATRPDASTETAAEINANTEVAAETDTNTETVAETGNTEAVARSDANTEMTARPDTSIEIAAETDANIETAAETDVNTPTAAEINANTEITAKTGANTETAAETANAEAAARADVSTKAAAETDANTFDARSAKPKRRSRRRRRGSPAAARGAVPVAAVANTETIVETDANTETNTRLVFERSDQILVEKQLQNQVSSGAAALYQPSPGRALVPLPIPPAATLKWPRVARTITLCITILAVASVFVLQIVYEKSIGANVPDPSVSLYSRSAAASVKIAGASAVNEPIPPISSASDTPHAIAADRGSAEAADQYANSLRPLQTTGTVTAVVSEKPTAKPAEAGRAQDRAPPASAPQTPPLQMSSTQALAGPDDLTSRLTQTPRDQADATPHSAPQARPSQGPGAQMATAPAPAAAEVTRPQLSTAPPSEPKLPPSSGESTQIVVGPDGQRLPSEVASPPGVDASASGGSQRSPLQEQLKPDEITVLIRRANDFLKSGDFSAARVLLKRGAESDSADAALMLGKTFDPRFLHETGAVGIEPDIARCRHWYQKAIELGSEAAAQRLANLAQTGQ